MAKTLIIVESPTKARTLSRYLGSDYRIEASMGHIRDLPPKRLGVNINKDFDPTYEVSKGKRSVVTKLQDAAKSASSVVLATDPDREGEAIAFHVAWVLGKRMNGKAGKKANKKQAHNPINRIVFHQITKSAIQDAIKHPRTIDMNLVDAQQGRRILDRLVGYKLSPILWYKTGKNWLSAGRVQSVAVKIIVDREREILAFVPDEYWEIYALLDKANSQQPTANKQQTTANRQQPTANQFVAKLVRIDDKKVEIGDKARADTVVADLETAGYSVATVEKKEIKRNPPAPYITSTLQRAASSSYGWSARKTMTIAQNLYEKGKITYHRTDSVQLSPEGIAMARSHIEKRFGKDYLPERPNIYTTKSKVAQEAHEAIRPTSVASGNQQPAANKQQAAPLGRDHQKLLDLVTKRFVASQMKPQIMERETVTVTATPKKSSTTYTLRASGENEVFPGWRAVYEERKKKPSKKSQQSEREKSELQALQEQSTIPVLSEKEMLNLKKLFPEQKFTQPPPRYNEASLIKALEEEGIGRPSTYAPTITTIQARQYVEKNDSRAFVPTDLGMIVNDFLVEHFGDVVNLHFTAEMEDKLDEIANGNQKWQDVIGAFWTPFDKHLQKTRKTVEKIKVPVKKTGEKCPECGNDLVERTGRYGAFVACSGFPKCKFTKPIVSKLDIKCEKCKEGDIVIKKTRKGRKFYGCSRYPECDFASWSKPKTS